MAIYVCVVPHQSPSIRRTMKNSPIPRETVYKISYQHYLMSKYCQRQFLALECLWAWQFSLPALGNDDFISNCWNIHLSYVHLFKAFK